MTQFVNYTLTIRNDGILVPEIDGDESRHGKFDSEQLKHINTHLNLLKTNKLDSREMFTDFGNYLFEALLKPVEISFSGEVWRQLNKSEDTKLRIRIVFEEVNDRGELANQIINLPWEFLCYPDDKNIFLGTHSRVALSCGYQSWLNSPLQGYTNRESPLRVLFVHGHPSKLHDVGFVKFVERILTELDDTVEVRELKDPTPHDLAEALSKRPHVLHFLGHGKPGALALGDLGNGEPSWLDDESLSDFMQTGGVKLVVLQACEGASPSEELAFTGTAAQLVKTHIPAVIAVRYPISQSLAWNFVKTLYGKLAGGEPVDVAVQSGREQLAIGNESHACRDFGAPVLWMRLRDGLLFPPPTQEETGQSSSELQKTIWGQILIDGTLTADNRIQYEDKVFTVEQYLNLINGHLGTNFRFKIVERGSVKITLEGSQEDFNLLYKFFKDGNFSETLGITIESLTIDIPQIEVTQKQQNSEQQPINSSSKSPRIQSLEKMSSSKRLQILENRKQRIESQIAELEKLSLLCNQEIRAETNAARRTQLNTQIDNYSQEIDELYNKVDEIQSEINKIKIT